jgi:hypothetical protein
MRAYESSNLNNGVAGDLAVRREIRGGIT